MLFIIIPAGQQYHSPAASMGASPARETIVRERPPGPRRDQLVNTPYSYEKASGNLNESGQTIFPRLLALCPTTIYDEQTVLPEGGNWGLFVGPRNRRLLLLNRTKGRIDVHMIMLFSMDAVFRQSSALINATARLFQPFGTEEDARALFADFDPLKVHCGLTNALIPEHINPNLDGRDDFRRLLGVWPHSFFVSNSSSNL